MRINNMKKAITVLLSAFLATGLCISGAAADKAGIEEALNLGSIDP